MSIFVYAYFLKTHNITPPAILSNKQNSINIKHGSA